MTTLKDSLTKDEVENIEKAERKSKRSKTKYGPMLGDSE